MFMKNMLDVLKIIFFLPPLIFLVIIFGLYELIIRKSENEDWEKLYVYDSMNHGQGRKAEHEND